jgi:hypothetical protein
MRRQLISVFHVVALKQHFLIIAGRQSVPVRYRVNENELEQAARSLSAYFEQQTVTIAVALVEL